MRELDVQCLLASSCNETPNGSDGDKMASCITCVTRVRYVVALEKQEGGKGPVSINTRDTGLQRYSITLSSKTT